MHSPMMEYTRYILSTTTGNAIFIILSLLCIIFGILLVKAKDSKGWDYILGPIVLAFVFYLLGCWR